MAGTRQPARPGRGSSQNAGRATPARGGGRAGAGSPATGPAGGGAAGGGRGGK